MEPRSFSLHSLCWDTSKSRCSYFASKICKPRFMDAGTDGCEFKIVNLLNNLVFLTLIFVKSHSVFLCFRIQSIQQWGNKRAAEFWECYLPSDFRRPQTDSYHSKTTPVN